MKINLLFHSLSITKVITTIALLILIISGSHIFIFLTTTHSQNINREAIKNLVVLKNEAQSFINAKKLDREAIVVSFNKFSPTLANKLLENKFFDVSHIYTANTDLKFELLTLRKISRTF